jgi:long-subunit fatty acid transport protein
MKYFISAVGALALTTSLAHAGGIERSGSNYSALFDKGRVMTLGFSNATPSISGSMPIGQVSVPTGNMAESFSTLSFSYKADVNDKLSYAIFMNTPFGADAHYTAVVYGGLEAHWQSNQLAALLKYQVTDRASVYGGLRYVTSSAKIYIPVEMLVDPVPPNEPFGPYTASAASDSQLGYVVGAAYEIPDIALRVGLTYESSITHSFATEESFGGIAGGTTVPGSTDITLPQSVALDLQTGVAKDTLIFGSVRWTEWSQWHVAPSYYDGVVHDEVTGFANDVITYELGVGRRINENLSVFARVGYEAPDGKKASRLAPTDGMHSFGIGASWTQDKVKITGGIEYAKLGDTFDASGTQFTGNSAVGVGVNVAFTF